MKYFYIDSEGNKKRYRGNVNDIDGVLVGTIINHKKNQYITELNKESDSVIEDKEITYPVYKDKYGNEIKISDSDEIRNNEVVKTYKEEFDITFTPPVEDKEYFTYKDRNGKIQNYTGEVREKNGRYFGDI